MSHDQTRIVADSMIGLSLPTSDRWSPLVFMVLGLNPGPFTGPGTNTYLIGTGADRLLLDTGQGVVEYLPLLERSIRAAGAKGICGIVLTHSHADHVGGLDSVLARFGRIPVWRMGTPSDESEHREVCDGDSITTEGATWRAIWTPGHAGDHLCFYLTEEHALFTGDMVLGAGTTVIPANGDLGDYLRSLHRLRSLEAEVLYPAHGPAIRDPGRKIDEYLAHRALRDRQILARLADAPKSILELVGEIYTDVPEYLHGAAALSVHAHLRKLALEELVRQEGHLWVSARGEG